MNGNNARDPPLVPGSSRPLRLLSLDGGGYRGLALLYQLRQVMRNIPGIDPSAKLYPCQYFDLIGGTSTGGLIALMLGRLGMDVQSAIEKYQELGPTIFGKDRGAFLGVVIRGAQFDPRPFEDALASWVGDRTMLDPDLSQHCRSFVTTIPGQLASVIMPTIIRSYADPPRSTVFSHQWLVREAARATSAAPTYFPPFSIGNGYTFKDSGAFGFNNPASLVLKEAELIPEFAGRTIGCVMSLGTGLASLARPVGPTSYLIIQSDAKAQASRIIQRTLDSAKKLFKTPNEAYDRLRQLKDDLVSTATNTEATHHSLFWTLRDRDQKVVYTRLNPPGGLDTIDLADFTRGADIEAVTNQYLEIPEVADQVVNCAITIAPIPTVAVLPNNLEADLPTKVLRSIKRDATVNMLSGDATAGFRVTLPKFSKLLAGRLNIQLDSATKFGSCAFELADRLGLLRGSMLNEVEDVPLDNLVHNGDRYCARISRHFLVWLISEHVQEIWQVGDRTYASTDIGRFTLYEHEGRPFVHYDGSIRSTMAPTIHNQALEDIQQVANGMYRSASGKDDEMVAYSPDVAILLLTPFPGVVHYMRHQVIEEFRLLNGFAEVLGDITESIIRTAQSPQSFAAAFSKDWVVSKELPVDHCSSQVEWLAASIQLGISLLGKKIVDMTARGVGLEVAQYILRDAARSHATFRGAEIDPHTFTVRCNDRFQELFDSHRRGVGIASLRQDLLVLLANPRRENIALVAAQLGLALLVKCNSQAILNLAKEAPEEWMRFVTAEDGDMFIGAMTD